MHLTFHIGDILTLITGIACYPNAMRGYGMVIHFIENSDVDYQEAVRLIHEQLPFLRHVDLEDMGNKNKSRIEAIGKKHGEYHVIELPYSVHNQSVIDYIEGWKLSSAIQAFLQYDDRFDYLR